MTEYHIKKLKRDDRPYYRRTDRARQYTGQTEWVTRGNGKSERRLYLVSRKLPNRSPILILTKETFNLSVRALLLTKITNLRTVTIWVGPVADIFNTEMRATPVTPSGWSYSRQA